MLPFTGQQCPPLRHPEAFENAKQLPALMHVGPLVNVHKQRLIASVIKSLVAGQHLASRVSYEVEPKLYWKCLRIKCLDVNTLRRLCTDSGYYRI